MRTTHTQRTLLGSICLATSALLTTAAAQPCPADESLPSSVRAVLDEVRDTRAGMYDRRESSVLGKVASPAEMAATHRDLRAHYMSPAPPLKLSAADKKRMRADYGRVSLFGRPRTGRPFALGITGAEVIDVQGRPELVVTRVESETPAASVLQLGDVIFGANQRLFPVWEDPRVPVGYAIAAAQTEAFDGTLTLHVGRDGEILDTRTKLPVTAEYAEDYPFDCKKSLAVAEAAVDYILEHGDDTFWQELFLMGVGDKRAMAHVRDNLRKSQQTGPIRSNWFGGYKLVSLAEYYLLTRDAEVLPAIRCHVKGLEANQMLCGGWSHGAPGGYGIMNQVGQICFIGLLLARECGVEVDPGVLARATGLSGRFIGAYGAYGDHAPGVFRYGKGAPFDNGIVPAHAVLFDLLGEEAVARRSARRSCYLYRTRMGGHAELIFTIAWSSVGAGLAPEPEFRMYADNMLWYHELARQRDGSLNCLGRTRYRRSTAAVGMVYTLTNRRLRITGAPKRTEPLFPIESLEGIETSDSPATRLPFPEVAKLDTPETWDTLIDRDGESLKTKPFEITRTSFRCDRTDYTALRVTLPAGSGGELFLNGDRVAAFTPAMATPDNRGLQTLDLGPRAAGILQRGENQFGVRFPGDHDGEIAIGLAAGPGMVEKRQIVAYPPDHGNNNRNGWVGTYLQHQQSVEWFFEDKPAEEIARYLAFPDWMGAQAAYRALASRGSDAIPLLLRLVGDTHAGVRVGAWDAIGVMHGDGLLSKEQCRKFSALAASRIGGEDAAVGEALGRAAAPMASGEVLATLLAGIASQPDIKAREFATNHARSGLSDRPELMIDVLRIVTASRLEQNTIRVLGGAMGGISRHAAAPEARGGVKEIAVVLDEVAPDMRGMFTDGLMHGGLAVIDQHLDAELEKTPRLVSGMTKCFVKVPDTDWPGWAFASLYLRRLHYRLGVDSAEEIRRTADQLVAGADDEHADAARRMERIMELKAWAALLERTKGDGDTLKAEALRMARSDAAAERLVALSLVWPSHRTIAAESARYHGRGNLADTARIQDPGTRLAVATAAAVHRESNGPLHWLMIWETAAAYQDRPQCERILPSLGAFFDAVAFRQRGTFMFRAIDTAAGVAQPLLGTPNETTVLARGLCKTYGTSSNAGWYVRTRDKLHGLVESLGKPSVPAMREAITQQRAWLGEAPEAEKRAVLNRDCPPQEVRRRHEELDALATELTKNGS